MLRKYGGRDDSLLLSVTPLESLITEHINGASLFETQEYSFGARWFIICDDIEVSGRLARTFTPSLGPGVAEVLSSYMTHGTQQINGPHFTHTMSNCGGVVAEAYKTIDECRHTHIVIAAK